MPLLQEVETLVSQFRSVFSREAAFAWFVIVIWALMLRMEAAGVTSIVRCLGLAASDYYNLLHFFHGSAFCVHALCHKWIEIVKHTAPLLLLEGKPLYVVDAIEVGKAGSKMPGVKLLHQQSNDNTKPDYIRGHFWGALSVLVGTAAHVFALPLRLQIHDGLKRSPSEAATLIDKMHTLLTTTLNQAGTVVADAYYSTHGFLRALVAARLHYIGKIRSTTVAYEAPPPLSCPRPRGRPRKYGPKVKLRKLFEHPQLFKPASLELYGDLKDILFYSLDLFWQGLWVRFVLTLYPDGTRSILISTNTHLSPEAILYAYSLRFKIEVSFKALVHVLFAFSYHFWMKAMSKISWGDGDLYLHRSGAKFRPQIYRKLEAYERFVNLSAIALGILQVLALNFPSLIWQRFPVWLRTLPKHAFPSENIVRLTLQHELHEFFLKSKDSLLLAEILARKQNPHSPAHPMKLAA